MVLGPWLAAKQRSITSSLQRSRWRTPATAGVHFNEQLTVLFSEDAARQPATSNKLQRPLRAAQGRQPCLLSPSLMSHVARASGGRPRHIARYTYFIGKVGIGDRTLQRHEKFRFWSGGRNGQSFIFSQASPGRAGLGEPRAAALGQGDGSRSAYINVVRRAATRTQLKTC